MEYEKLHEIIDSHEKWLRNEGGKKMELRKADLFEANLGFADLREADLVRSNLERANLCGVKLKNADLREVCLSEANLNRADLSGADLRRADLEEANLIKVNLSGADLSGANLWGADLQGSNLENANLQGANLINADLRGANLSGAKLDVDIMSEKAKSEVDEKAMEQPENSMMDAQNCAESFNEEFKVELTYAGECRGGQYPGDKVDEQDGPLLRADLYRRIDDNPAEDFADESCSSILTNIPADIQVEKAQEYADSILEHLERGQEWISNETLLVNAVGIAEKNIGIPMTEEQLQHKLYDIYQLDWMMYHGYSLADIIKGMEEQPHDAHVFEEEDYGGKQVDVSGIYKEWEQDRGFGGEIFACYEEFCENEYLDYTQMQELIRTQPIELADKLEEIYGEYYQAREEREQQEDLERYFPPDIMGEEVFQRISDVLEKEQGVIEYRAEAARKHGVEDSYCPRSLEDAIKIFTPVTGADMLEVLKDEAKMDSNKQNVPFADTVLDGALRYDTKFNRKEAYKKVKEWMKKPCDKVAKEIEKLQEKNRAQGR